MRGLMPYDYALDQDTNRPDIISILVYDALPDSMKELWLSATIRRQGETLRESGSRPNPMAFETLFGENRKAKRDENFFKIADVISEMATCLRAKHGAVIVNKENRIVCTGYNGSLPGQPHCSDVGCDIRYTDATPHCHRTIHAERNALMQAARFGIPVDGCRIYVTGEPCEECAKHLSAAGVSIVERTRNANTTP